MTAIGDRLLTIGRALAEIAKTLQSPRSNSFALAIDGDVMIVAQGNNPRTRPRIALARRLSHAVQGGGNRHVRHLPSHGPHQLNNIGVDAPAMLSTARGFSAIAYFFGREISEHEQVPVGLIDSTWGGTPAHSWISPEGLAAANLTSVFEDAGTIDRDQGRADQIRAYYAREDAALQAEGKPPATHPRIPGDRGGAWVLREPLVRGPRATRGSALCGLWSRGDRNPPSRTLRLSSGKANALTAPTCRLTPRRRV